MTAVTVRRTAPSDFDAIIALSRRVYPWASPWSRLQLACHLGRFPEGQWVAVDRAGSVVGMAASLLVHWRDHDPLESWDRFTADGYFASHDPTGHTLYGAEVMVDPAARGRQVGHVLYQARKALVQAKGLRRIRAGARLSGYGAHSALLAPAEYLEQVLRGALHDPTLSFQLAEGFQVLGLIPHYLGPDPECLGWAALIEWVNLDAGPRGGA